MLLRTVEAIAPAKRRIEADVPARPPASRHLGLASSCLHAVVLLVCAFDGYWSTFSQFAPYDDEGYHLWSLTLFAGGHSLYDSVFSYYGPFHYELWGGLSALTGITFSPNAGRLVIWALWLATSLLLALIARRLTGRRLVAVIVQILSFRVLTGFESEPMYAGDTALVLVCAVLGAAAFLLRSHPRIAWTAIGALLGAALLTKINVGAYAAIAVGYAVVISMPPGRRRSVVRVPVIAALVLVAPLVMVPTLSAEWTRRYAALVCGAAVALALVATRRPAEGEAGGALEPRCLIWLIAGLGGTVAAGVGAIFATGTSPRALYDSVILTASRQAGALSVPVVLGASVYAWAILAPVVAWFALRPPARLRRRGLGAALRLLAGLTIWCSVAGVGPPDLVSPLASRFVLALPLAWVAAVPAAGDDWDSAGRCVKRLLPALAVLQAVIAYPVAGTQDAFGSVLFLVCGAVCVADGLSELPARIPGRRWVSLRVTPKALATAITGALAVLFTIQAVITPAREARRLYDSEQRLPFAGATLMRQSPLRVTMYTGLVNTLRSRCHTLITLPGMLSLNLWSHIPAPSGLHEEPWWAVLSPRQQQIALARARAAPGLCLVRNDFIASFWLQDRPLPQVPLVRFLEHDFKKVAQYGTYVLSVRVQRAGTEL